MSRHGCLAQSCGPCARCHPRQPCGCLQSCNVLVMYWAWISIYSSDNCANLTADYISAKTISVRANIIVLKVRIIITKLRTTN